MNATMSVGAMGTVRYCGEVKQQARSLRATSGTTIAGTPHIYRREGGAKEQFSS